MDKISSRDQKLLALMFVVVIIFALFRFVYQPVITSVNENKETLESYQIQQTNMMNALARYGAQDETIDQLNDNINERLNSVTKYHLF